MAFSNATDNLIGIFPDRFSRQVTITPSTEIRLGYEADELILLVDGTEHRINALNICLDQAHRFSYQGGTANHPGSFYFFVAFCLR